MRSSSLHRINADKGLGKRARRLWYFANWLNNSILPKKVLSSLKISSFSPKIMQKDWLSLDSKSSPSRIFSDLFWMKLPWKKLQGELGEIHTLDTGCGSGNYGPRLQTFSENRISSYMGFDVFPSPNWESLETKHDYLSFEVNDSSKIYGDIQETTNFFISQSAIEHFEEDLTFFRNIREYISDRKQPAIQIHLFPSSICLRLYRWHGIRQYTPRTISLISKLFEDFSETILYNLGGKNANKLHWNFITKPIYVDNVGDLRDVETNLYSKRLVEAITKDAQVKDQSEPAFYALVIHSFPTQPLKLFDENM